MIDVNLPGLLAVGTDIARAELFGEPREMSDEFVGDVHVAAP